MSRFTLVFAVAFATSAAAYASSDTAWADFTKDVSTKCLEAAKGSLEKPSIVVDPFGTESYGVAILNGKAVGADARVSYLCVYNKQDKTAQIGSELPADKLGVTIP